MSLCMDNFRFDVTAWAGNFPAGFNILEHVMRLAFADHGPATHYVALPRINRKPPEISQPACLIFFWSGAGGSGPERNCVALPFKLDYIGAADWTKRWLAEAEYPPEPDHDGDNSRGWRIFNEAWGRVGNFDYAFVGIEPAWAMHGK